MTDLSGIAPALAAALAERGYETLTAVQLAVLGEGAAGRDLLVSAQTGSGKTVAFGIAIAPDLLAGEDRLAPAAAPLALVVAPTRELALQVARELEWLYAGAGAGIATCVGGMDYRSERRALARGAHIVVGTPGRLRDHITRGSLDLSGVRAVVLDEADEMLDLGFSEDLEFILGSAPEERRALMFSATVPPEIERLAAHFQRDALRLRTAGEARQHTDIDYHCFSVAQDDREHAIINVLRYYEAERAIVFCKTRAEVSRLLGRFHNRGFQVVALSGELSQTERLHALQAVRDGRARVCIATDVAARGIDLPGLELVVHADLPQNPEALLHRSGRTGRAGRRGVSALIVTPRDYKKAQRLLQAAQLTAVWGGAPSPEAVLERDEARLLAAPELAAPVGEDEAAAVAALIRQHDMSTLAAGFLRLWRAGRSAPEEIAVLAAAPAPAPAVKRDLQAFGDSVWYALSIGHEGRAEARWILPKLCESGRITRAAIGAIRVQRELTFIQIAAAAAPAFEEALGDRLEVAPGLCLTRQEAAPDTSRPEAERRSPPQRRARPEPSPREDAPQEAPAWKPQPGDASREKPVWKKPRWDAQKKVSRGNAEGRRDGAAPRPAAPTGPAGAAAAGASARARRADQPAGSEAPKPKGKGAAGKTAGRGSHRQPGSAKGGGTPSHKRSAGKAPAGGPRHRGR